MLTRFSQRYGSGDAQRLAGEAAMAFGGQVVLAHDLTGSPFRPGSRQRPANDLQLRGLSRLVIRRALRYAGGMRYHFPIAAG